jgi:putative chitinase
MMDPTESTPTGPSGRLLAVTDAQLSIITGLSVPVPPGTAALLNDSVCDAGITTHLELAHYVGQTCYESNYFRTFIESPLTAQAYEGRKDLGNTTPGDGVLFRGRGAIQLTGRANYESFYAWLAQRGYPSAGLVPEDVGTPPFRFLAAAFYWSTHPALSVAADNDDVTAVTRIINGGTNGLWQRITLTDRAEEQLG